MLKKIFLYLKNNRIIWIFIISLSVVLLLFKFETRKDILENRFSNLNYMGEVGTWAYLGDDIFKTFKELMPINEEKMETYIKQFVSSREIYPYEGFTVKNKDISNIVLIQLEGIDEITFNLKVNNEYVMPNLNLLKKKSVYINNAYDESGSGRTSDGEFLALTSLLPVANESMYIQYSLDNIASLPKILSQNGFKTVSIHGFEGSFYNRRTIHQQLGYNESYFLEELSEEAKEEDYLGWGLSDEFILNKAAEIIEASDDKLFLHAIMLTNHHPFDSATGAYEDVLFHEPENIVQNYLNSVRYTDLVIGNFIEELRKSGEMDNTLLVIFSDHDSGITEEIYNYYELDYDPDSFQYDKIPLLFYDGYNKKEEGMISGQSDIMPMILSYLDLNIPNNCMGLNYVDNKKIVYKQGYSIIGVNEIIPNTFDMDQVTKSFVEIRSKE